MIRPLPYLKPLDGSQLLSKVLCNLALAFLSFYHPLLSPSHHPHTPYLTTCCFINMRLFLCLPITTMLLSSTWYVLPQLLFSCFFQFPPHKHLPAQAPSSLKSPSSPLYHMELTCFLPGAHTIPIGIIASPTWYYCSLLT